MAYGSCTPDPQCSGELPCCPQVITPGLSFALGLSLGEALSCAFMHFTAFQACEEGGDPFEADVPFVKGEDFEVCFVCTLAFWFWAAKLGPPPTGCAFIAGMCGDFDLGLGGGPTTPLAVSRGTAAPNMVTSFRALRDQLLGRSTAGQRWITLYDQHSPALIHAVPTRPWLIWQISDALGAWLPAVQALVDGQGASVTITPAMMTDWLAILDELQAAVPADTAAAMQEERARLDLPSFVGLAMEHGAGALRGCRHRPDVRRRL